MGLHVSTLLRGPEDESVESKHVALLSHYIFNITTVVFDGPSPPFKNIRATSDNNGIQQGIFQLKRLPNLSDVVGTLFYLNHSIKSK